MSSSQRPKPFVMLILDGYGISFIKEGNAIAAAKKPVLDRLMSEYPVAAVRAGGEDVGLPWGEMGNSETGHQNIGSGRVLYQFLPRIDKAIEDETFFDNEALQKAITHVKKNKGAVLHTIGMLSNGGVHSHMNHQFALLQAAAHARIGDRTHIHVILDGQDSSPEETEGFFKQLEKAIDDTGAGKIATIIGRYYAMDRAENWNCTQVAYDMLTKGEGTRFPTWQDALDSIAGNRDKKAVTNAEAMVIATETPIRNIQDGDAMIFYNFRSDRARQLTGAFADQHWNHFPVEHFKDFVCATMASYNEDLPTDVFFPDEVIEHPLGEIFAENKLKQLRIAESEKFAHVTYFFNGGREKPYPGETDVKIPSENSKDFSKHPRMKAEEITDRVLKEIEAGTYDVIVMNYANADMVGHTGKLRPTIEAIECLDEQVGRVAQAVLAKDGAILLTCDHGKAEVVINHMTHKPSTDHTNNPVPVMYISNESKLKRPKDERTLQEVLAVPIGFLADVAPTALDILGIKKPKEMTAQSLLSSLS